MKNIDLYLANLLVGNVKLHNLHWNVVGLDFKAVHEYLETLYDDFFVKFDEVAELQKQLGEFPKASVKEYLEISDVEELPSDHHISSKDAIEEALVLIKRQRDLAEKIRMEADEDQYVISNMMEDHIAGYDKEIWFMESMIK